MYDQQKGEKDDSSLVYRERKKGGSKVIQQRGYAFMVDLSTEVWSTEIYSQTLIFNTMYITMLCIFLMLTYI